jgi:nucleoid DNA-binding protein
MAGKHELVKRANAALEKAGAKVPPLTETHATALFATLLEMVIEGDRVQINKFGTFRRIVRGEHKGRDPRTGESIDIPAHAQLGLVLNIPPFPLTEEEHKELEARRKALAQKRKSLETKKNGSTRTLPR